MSSGLVNIDRALLRHPIFKNEPFTEREAWIWMICEAAWKERRVRTAKGTVSLERGQLTASTRFMADVWQWSEATVRRFLKRLKNDAMIDAQTDAVQTVITICNYDKFQDWEAYRDAMATQPVTRKRRGDDAEMTQTRTPEGTPEGTPEKVLGVSRAKRKTSVPDGFSLSEEMRLFAAERGVEGVDAVFESFKAHHEAKGSMFTNWAAAWRTWVLNERKFNEQRGGSGAGGKPVHNANVFAGLSGRVS